MTEILLLRIAMRIFIASVLLLLPSFAFAADRPNIIFMNEAHQILPRQ